MIRYHRLFIIIGLILLFSCENHNKEILSNSTSEELLAMFQEDQAVRTGKIEVESIKSGKKRRLRVLELLSQNKINSAQDKMYAAYILQHTSLRYCGEKLVSSSPENYYLAHKLACESLKMGNEQARQLVAATIDRYLVYTKGIQKYGTQRGYNSETGQEYLLSIDSTTTDAERKKYGVPPLNELKKKYPFNESGG